MLVRVNGDERDFPDGMTIRSLIEDLGLGAGPIAVEVNRHLVPRAAHESTVIREGDSVEVVTVVGGG
ncbi:MAG: sulfur carrier protein ThiS [Planctomycetes bacterium]|nr:sulfur carrier protein ThiS [Planctomycetota bacterium]